MADRSSIWAPAPHPRGEVIARHADEVRKNSRSLTGKYLSESSRSPCGASENTEKHISVVNASENN